MENWQVALVVLAAVLVGVAIPVLVQLRATLRALEKALQTSGARVDEALVATTAAAARLDALVVRLEEGGRIERLIDGVTAVSRMANQVRDTIRVASGVGAAVAPAVIAAMQAFRGDRDAATPAPPLEVTEPAVAATEPEPRKQAIP